MRNFWKNFCKKNKKQLWFLTIVLCTLAMTLMSYSTYEDKQIEKITYNEFLKDCKAGKVDTIYYNKTAQWMKATYFNKETKNMSRDELDKYTYKSKDMKKILYPSYDNFRKDMLGYNVNLVITDNTNIIDILTLLISLGLPLILLIWLMSAMNAQMKGLDEKTIIQKSDVKFSDVIGQDEILEDIKFITKLIKNPKLSEDIGAKVPKGVLLTGAPGTGKTLIAKAIAGEAGVPFISISGSVFKELYVGNGARRVRQLFKIAQKNRPCIIFIDEIDSVGVKRDSSRADSESEQTINALLTEMDGFSGREGIFILAATNHPEKLDSALIRSGRFDRQIAINPPRNWEVRKELFKHYLKDYKLSDDIDIDTLSKTVSGFTGADIAMVCNEAGIIAIMHDKKAIDNDCIEEAIDKKIFNGNRSKKEVFKKDKEIVAYHESGHAVMSYLLHQPIARASIIGTTSGVGGAVFREDKDSCFITNEEMQEHVMIAYAGRASEEIKFNIVTTGSSNDITQATQTLIAYIEKYGFDKDFGMLDMEVLAKQSLIESEEMTKRLSKMAKEIYEKTKQKLIENYDLVEKLSQKLLEVETLSGADIESLFDNKD